MIYRLIFHNEAKDELAGLYDYIADESGPDRAWSYVSGIRKFCVDLADFPKRGTERADIAPGLRVIGYRRSASIAFCVADDLVVILGIYYAGRSFSADDIERRISTT